MKPKRIVLLGIGHTNAHFVKQWPDFPIDHCELVCVSPFPDATYSGMLPGTLGGQFDDQAMRIDLDSLIKSVDARLVIDDTVSIDLANRQLKLSQSGKLRYDVLVIGVGSMPQGYRQFSDQPSVVPIKPMQTFLARLDQAKREHAPSPDATVSIVGGGVAGVEISLCLRQHFSRTDDRSSIRIVTSGDGIAPGLNKRSIRRLEGLLRDRRIDRFCNQTVVHCDHDGLGTQSGLQIDSDVAIWATGAAPPPVLAKLNLALDSKGFIATRATLQSITDDRVFAVGDCGTIIDSPCPKAGVYAVRQGPILWDNVCSLLTDGSLKEFRPQRSFLKLLNTGDGRALLDYGRFSFHAQWCLALKNYIDHSFIQDYQVNSNDP